MVSLSVRLFKNKTKYIFQKKKKSKQNTWNRKPSLPTSSYAHLENWTRSLCCLESPSSTEIIPRSSCINTDHSILSPDGHPARNYRFGYNKALWKLPCLDLRISRDEDPPMSPGNYSWYLITSSVKALLCRKDWSVVHQQHCHGCMLPYNNAGDSAPI